MEHLETCLAEKRLPEGKESSIIIHVSPKSDNRYYLALIVRPDAAFYTLIIF